MDDIKLAMLGDKEAAKVVLDGGFGSNPGENDFLYRRRKDMAEIALSALRPVSREQVEKVWRGELGEWYFDEFCGEYKNCLKCGARNELPANFCRNCGALLTDEAVQMVMERLEALKDDQT